MNRFRELILLFVLCSFQFFCLGDEISFSKLSVENGLSSNLVKAIYQDSYGFIWLGTLEGLDRYDGVEIRPYSQKFPEAIENVYAITEDAGKNLWVGTATGLFWHNMVTNTFGHENLGTQNLTIQSLALTPDSDLYVGTTNGLYLVNTKTRQTEQLKLNPNQDHTTSINIMGIFPDNHGNCWLATTTGLIMYSEQTKKSEYYRYKNDPEDVFNSFTSICNIGNKIYLGTSNMGIVEFDLSSKKFSSGIKTDNNIILTLNSDNKELLFAGTDGGGLKVINTRTGQITNIVNQDNNSSSLSSNSIYSFYLDENNRYWIGTYTGGVNYTKSVAGNFKVYPVATEFPEANKSIRSFYFAPDGSKYFGTRNGFIVTNKDGNSKFFRADPNNTSGLRSNIILSVYPFENNILIGTYGGGASLYSVSDQKIRPFINQDIFLHSNIYGFETDKSGNLWITTFNGVYRYSPKSKSIVNFNKQNSGLKSDEIFDIRFDSQGRLWLGSMSGPSVYLPNGNQLKRLKLPASAENNFKTNYIYEDQAGNIWICTERGGLIRIDPDLSNSKTYRDSDGLPDNSVCAIIERSTGEYWISTLKGFCKFSSRTQKFTKFSISDGLPGLVFTPAASYLAPDGTLYFGNEKGLIYFSPAETSERILKSHIRLTDFYLSGKVVEPGPQSVLKQTAETVKGINLSNRSSSIGFRFIDLNFINPADNDYQYKMEGLDKNWKDNGSNNTVFYQKLKPGNYIFKVRNNTEQSETSGNIVEVKIDIHHSLFSSPAFLSFIFVLIAAGAFLVVSYIRRLQKARSRIPEKSEKYKGSRISETESNQVVKDLKRYMEEKKPYLNSDLKLADLASDLNYPMHEISQVLNQSLNQSFSDFVNKYRVEEVKKRMEDKAYEKFTFIAIAQQCGFNSKTSFYRIFKNETGKTPADYLKDLNQNKNPEE